MERAKNMKIDKERKAFLRNELNAYEKTHPMSDKERRTLLAWINAGNSVYENTMMAVGYDYLTEYRDTEYIRNTTKGMSSEDASKFAWNHYGWDYDSKTPDNNVPSLEEELLRLGY